MSPYSATNFDDDDNVEGSERELGARPERTSRTRASRRVRMRATRRNRSSEMAKRGMHQRRNRRVQWG